MPDFREALSSSSHTSPVEPAPSPHVVGDGDERDRRLGPRQVRITNPIGPFRWAKGCSTCARIADVAAFAWTVRFGSGLPFGLRWWMRLTLPMLARKRSFSAER